MKNNSTSFGKGYYLFAIAFALLIANAQPVKAQLTLDPQGFQFGPVLQGVTACHTVTMTNTSHTQNITVTGWQLSVTNSEITVAPASYSQNLQPGGTLSLQICYTPDGSHDAFQNALIVSYTMTGHDTLSHTAHIGFSGSLDHHNTDTTHHDDTTHHTGDTTHHAHHCLTLHHGDGSNDPVVIGATAEHVIYLINASNKDINVTSAQISGSQAGVFTITSIFPLLVPANSSTTTLTYNFSPDSSGHHVFTADLILTLSGDSLDCQTVSGNVIGYPVLEHNQSGHNIDTVIHPLFPSEHRTLGIEGNGHHTTMTFYFTNNLTVDVTVNNIYLDDATYFTIASTDPSPTPFVLHPGDRLTVVINYIATDQLVHHAHLMIDADHQLQSRSFDLQGIQLVAASA